jgi:lipopolysaccharide/colanic/teichoic acid biosynthesis glycosyltransferase
MMQPAWKRACDLAIAVPALLLLSPLVLAIGMVIRWQLGTPVLFRQVRPGLGGRLFTLIKFRTMRDQVDAKGAALPDEARLPPLGRQLRSMSLDELLELLHVIRGEMSLVGPRPLLTEYLPLYSSEQARRHEVRPGLTGWAQIHGRNAITWEKRFALDVWYVDHMSLRLDLCILWRTMLTVISRQGISHPGHATMERFRGNAG